MPTAKAVSTKAQKLKSEAGLSLPILPLRDVVVYPFMVIPLFVGRQKSVQALEAAMSGVKQVLLLAQKNPEVDDPDAEDLYDVGTVVTILQLLRLPDGTIKVLIEGTQRAHVVRFTPEKDFLQADVVNLPTLPGDPEETKVLVQAVITQFEQYVKLSQKIPAEVLTTLTAIDNPMQLAYIVSAHLSIKVPEQQNLLELNHLIDYLERLLVLIETGIEQMQIDRKVRGMVRRQMEKNQREYYLNEQMKAIQNELSGDSPNDFEVFAKKIEKSGMPKEALEKAKAELQKLKAMPPMAAEATVSRNYLDAILGVPWKKMSRINSDLNEAEKILQKDHYGLEKVQQRIVEYLAVQKRVNKLKGPVLCLVGPPGVGKTSLGQSIARATGRTFVRMSLGGVRDEAEIRGHRRTYIGSMPGRIIQKLSKAGVKNPLFLLDEVDKMAMDFRGDPAAALLEVLDPEQNNTFNDHYLEVDYDLSDVMFVATANTLNIPAPLLDRMEVIRIPGYTEDEKLHIALQHLMSKQFELNGLKPHEVSITSSAILEIIRYYTREAGVRNLEREISKICRKVVKEMVTKPTKPEPLPASKKGKTKAVEKKHPPLIVSSKNIEKYLGVRKFRYGSAEDHDQIGQVNGLAWTEVGGELLTIESAVVVGKGKTTSTGQLGSVMQESIQAALTVVRSRSSGLGLADDFQEKMDIHVHVPEGATPKDGPSAGVGMCTAMVSALTKIPVRADVAMTGEITLRGEVLPIGGLKEKLLAAQRGGIHTVIIPEENKRDLKEIPKNITRGLDIHPVRWIDQVFALALQRMPQPVVPSPLPVPGAIVAKEATKGTAAH